MQMRLKRPLLLHSTLITRWSFRGSVSCRYCHIDRAATSTSDINMHQKNLGIDNHFATATDGLQPMAGSGRKARVR